MNRSLTILLALFCAAVTVSSTCIAAPGDPVSHLVRYDDLDLSKSADVRLLHRRIDRAANATCLHATGPSPAATVDMSCKGDAVRAARARAAELVARREAAAAPNAPISLTSAN